MYLVDTDVIIAIRKGDKANTVGRRGSEVERGIAVRSPLRCPVDRGACDRIGLSGNDLNPHRIIALIAILCLAACASGHPTNHASRPSADTADAKAAEQQLADAIKLVADENWPQAADALHTVIEARTFRRFPDEVQYRTLRTAGQVALDHGSLAAADDYLVRTTALPQAGIDDWQHRLVAASRLGNDTEMVNCLTVLVQRWPDRAIKYSSNSMLDSIRLAERLPHGAGIPLFQALYDAHWRLHGDIEPSGAWRYLVLRLLDRGQFAEAIEVSAHVTHAYDLIAMRADRRFDELVARNPKQFDIGAAADRELQALQAASERMPDSLELKSEVIQALVSRQHYEAALAAADAVLLDIRSTNFASKVYPDYDEVAAWFFNLRSIALQRVGRSDEAIAQLEKASLLHKDHKATVNQLIDLGYRYCILERPKDALTAIGRVYTATNPRGAMDMEFIRLYAAFQLGDSKQVERSLHYLRSHRADAPLTYELGLLAVNQLDRAATDLIVRLEDEDARQEALLSVQDFAMSPGPPRLMTMDAQWRALIARRDVQAAIHRVGRIESYRLEESLFAD